MPVEKNKEYIVEIIDNSFEGSGIAKIDNFTIFIPNTIKGEKVKILIVKVLKKYAYGKVIKFLETSMDRTKVDCENYKYCGGCDLRHIKYDKTLEIKRNAIQSLVNKTLKNKIEVDSVLGMDNPYYYRNKAQYPVGLDDNKNAITGIYANRTHKIINLKNCLIQNKEGQEIAKDVIKFINENKISVYDEDTLKGLIRHIVIKVGIHTNEIMCIIVINGDKIPKEDEFVKYLISKYPNIKSITKNINTKNTNVIMGDKNINIYGNGYITDKLGEYLFRISPNSFYQINPIQAEKLYNIGVEAANITKNDVVFDLYSGIGTISIFMSKYAKKVYGIEIVNQAVEDAKENAKINKIDNIEFICGNVEEIVDNLINVKKVIPDIVMLDPPRKGVDDNTIKNILKIKPKKLVYISCNPATLVRDIGKLEDTYKIEKIKPVDMFPYTHHVESISVLTLID